jgi:hypothetical protein
MTLHLTDAQVELLRRVLSDAAIDSRLLLRDALSAGLIAGAGFHAEKLVRVERAAHVVWGMADYFPSDEAGQ